MKKIIITLFITTAAVIPGIKSYGQSIADCLKQLSLDYQKLAQMKSLLQQSYSGYNLLEKGYTLVTGAASGNYKVHETFINGLLSISPNVSSYPKARQTIDNQLWLLAEYKNGIRLIERNKNFSSAEILYASQVFNNLLKSSIDNLNDLSTLINPGQLRMTDGDRIEGINSTCKKSEEQLTYIRKFNVQLQNLVLKRQARSQEYNQLKTLHGIN